MAEKGVKNPISMNPPTNDVCCTTLTRVVNVRIYDHYSPTIKKKVDKTRIILRWYFSAQISQGHTHYKTRLVTYIQVRFISQGGAGSKF